MTKVIAIAFCTLFCSIVIKEENKTFSLFVSLAGAILIFITVSDKVYELFSQIISLSADVPAGMSYVKLMLKVLGVVLITGFTCDVCRDNGENALASFVETAAKTLVLSMIMPLFETIINIVTGLVK